MSWEKAFVVLDKALHDRASFDSGEQELNVFLQTFALKHMKAGISRTMVLPAEICLMNQKKPICAFYSVAPSTISRESLPESLAKKLPQYPIPVFLLAQLAVHSDYHGRGLGKVALIKALEYLVNVLPHLPAYAVVVDCLNERAEAFYRQYGFELLCVHNDRVRLFLPMKTVQKLF